MAGPVIFVSSVSVSKTNTYPDECERKANSMGTVVIFKCPAELYSPILQ